MCSFLAFKALMDLDTTANDNSWINLICLFDHEECGSQSAQGANANLLPGALKRIFNSVNPKENQPTDLYEACIAKSFQISADMSHSIHPNYSAKHHENHRIKINDGVGVKTNYN